MVILYCCILTSCCTSMLYSLFYCTIAFCRFCVKPCVEHFFCPLIMADAVRHADAADARLTQLSRLIDSIRWWLIHSFCHYFKIWHTKCVLDARKHKTKNPDRLTTIVAKFDAVNKIRQLLKRARRTWHARTTLFRRREIEHSLVHSCKPLIKARNAF